ncbi:hypothetical protein [Streptomyces sp. NPDC055085]
MLNLLTSPRTARTVRAVLGSLAGTVTEFAIKAADTWATVTDDTATPAAVEVPDPEDVVTTDELPTVETIEAAAKEYERAADQARRADRGKRAAKKVLDKLPAGIYGGWKIFRTPSSRQTPDLAAITATYKQLGLGPVPMKDCAPSLKLERAETVTAPVAIETLTVVAA